MPHRDHRELLVIKVVIFEGSYGDVELAGIVRQDRRVDIYPVIAPSFIPLQRDAEIPDRTTDVEKLTGGTYVDLYQFNKEFVLRPPPYILLLRSKPYGEIPLEDILLLGQGIHIYESTLLTLNHSISVLAEGQSVVIGPADEAIRILKMKSPFFDWTLFTHSLSPDVHARSISHRKWRSAFKLKFDLAAG